MPATGLLIGTPASISASVPPQTLAIEDEPFDSRMSETMRIVYGKTFLGRQHLAQRPLGQRAVADLAAAGAAQELHLADRERREVVVQHEALAVLGSCTVSMICSSSEVPERRRSRAPASRRG